MSKKNKKTTANGVTPGAASDTGDEALMQDERDALSTLPPDVFTPEDQGQRWLKYGSNVVLVTVVVLLLAALALWAFNADAIPFRGKVISLKGRADLTSDSSNELKPQTKQLVKDLGTDVTLVSLYPKLKKEESATKGADTYQKVQDILDEYQRNSPKIKVEMIDPVADPARLDAWLGQVKRTYGANIDKYEKFVKEEVPAAIAEIKPMAETEAKAISALVGSLGDSGLTEEQNRKLGRTMVPARTMVTSMPELLEQLSELSKELLTAKIPDYAEAVKLIREGTVAPVGPGIMTQVPGMNLLRDNSKALVTIFGQLKDDTTLPEVVRKYAGDAIPRFQKLHDKADETLKKADSLGTLKLDDVRNKLLPTEEGAAAPPAIAVMGAEDVKVIEDRDLWKSGQATGLTGASAEKPRLRFAGEQQLTSAILSLANPTKKKVAFIRAGGQPLISSGGGFMGMGGPGPYGSIADRLRSYNFEVLEKDFGPQQRPDPTHPSDDDVKDAIWIVFAAPNQMDPRMGGMPTAGMLGDRLRQHLDAGGSAMCLMTIESEDLSAALKDWGIEVKTGTILVHEQIEGGSGASGDYVEQARRNPPIFILNEYGEHPITTPLRTLDAAMVPLVQVTKLSTTPAGVKVTQILPIPNTPKAWGENDLDSLRSQSGRRPGTPEFDPAVDAGQPLFAGAVAEKEGKGRLVVIGTQEFIHNGILGFPDQEVLEKSKMEVARFPGNAELFTNSVFWLSKQDSMMALGPAALDTARIAPIPQGKLSFIKVGLVLVLLPLLSVAAGISIWLTRRA